MVGSLRFVPCDEFAIFGSDGILTGRCGCYKTVWYGCGCECGRRIGEIKVNLEVTRHRDRASYRVWRGLKTSPLSTTFLLHHSERGRTPSFFMKTVYILMSICPFMIAPMSNPIIMLSKASPRHFTYNSSRTLLCSACLFRTRSIQHEVINWALSDTINRDAH